MTIGAVGGSRAQVSYESLEDISIGNPMAHLARVLMESKDRQEETEDLAFDGAKASIEKHNAEEVSKLHDAADATFDAALVGAAMTVGGAALSAVAIAKTPGEDTLKASRTPEAMAAFKAQQASAATNAKQLGIAAGALTNLAGPVGKMLDKRTLDFQADATKARGEAALARTDLDRADSERKRAINGRDEALSTLKSSIKQAHDARMEAIQSIRG